MNLRFLNAKPLRHSLFLGLLFVLILGSGCYRTVVKKIRIDSQPNPSGTFKKPLKNLSFLSPFGKRGKGYHTGVDIRGRYGGGDPVYAARSGKVIKVGKGRGYGKMISIKHSDGYLSRYAHLKKFLVQQGDQVEAGHPIGIVGRTGRASTPHLHFEILTSQGRFVDPWPLIK